MTRPVAVRFDRHCEACRAVLKVKAKGRLPRFCKPCRSGRPRKLPVGQDYVVPGYRDQFCPLCEAGPFVSATKHLVAKHDMTAQEVHRRWGVLSSRTFREGTLDRYGKGEPNPRPGRAFRQADTQGARWRRWLKLVEEERAFGDEYLARRVAQRWKVSHSTAKERLAAMRRAGVLDWKAPKPSERLHCRKGHPLAGSVRWQLKNGYLTRTCLTCVNERARENHRRQLSDPRTAALWKESQKARNAKHRARVRWVKTYELESFDSYELEVAC